MTPRRLAVKALIHQEQAGYANLVLDAELKKCTPPLDSRDAAFAARIFYTTLERLPLLDYRINQFTKKPVAKLDAPVRAVLRAGLAQALYMNVPLPTETALRSFAAQAGLESLGDWAAPADSPYGCALYSTNGGALITASTHPYTYQDYVGTAPVSSDRWYYSLTLQLRTEDQLPG